MSHYIGNVEIKAITDIDGTTERPTQEVKALGMDEPYVAEFDPEFEELEIDIALIDDGDKTVSEQREEIMGLESRDPLNNAFQSGDYRGWLAVSNVEIPRGQQTYAEGTVTATYIPWPEEHPDRLPTTPDESGFGSAFGAYFGSS